MNHLSPTDPESLRLQEDARREKNWKRWGPYLSERQWGTVREDYSRRRRRLGVFPARPRPQPRLSLGRRRPAGHQRPRVPALLRPGALERPRPDPQGAAVRPDQPEGNHGEDVKECYFYLDATPTHSYMKALYKYPQAEFPYARLVEENRRRGRDEPEFELIDTGVFDERPLLRRLRRIRQGVAGRHPDPDHGVPTAARRPATLHLLPTLWFRNTWSWGCDTTKAAGPSRRLQPPGDGLDRWPSTSTLGPFHFCMPVPDPMAKPPTLLFTENETNIERLFGVAERRALTSRTRFTITSIHGEREAVNPAAQGTKAAAHYLLTIPAAGQATVALAAVGRADEAPATAVRPDFDASLRAIGCARPTSSISSASAGEPRRRNAASPGRPTPGCSGRKQFYHYVGPRLARGRSGAAAAAAQPQAGPQHRLASPVQPRRDLDAGQVGISLVRRLGPGFHMRPVGAHRSGLRQGAADPAAARMVHAPQRPDSRPTSWRFGDVNPPVHAWAVLARLQDDRPRGPARSAVPRPRLPEAADQLHLVGQPQGRARASISSPAASSGWTTSACSTARSRCRGGGRLEQADGTAWMAFYCLTMLVDGPGTGPRGPGLRGRRLEVLRALRRHRRRHEHARRHRPVGRGGRLLLRPAPRRRQRSCRLRIRSMVGLIPLFAVEVLEDDVIDRLPGFRKRMHWFLENRRDLAEHISYCEPQDAGRPRPSAAGDSVARAAGAVLRYLLDENEFLSPFGIRSLSRYHEEHPLRLCTRTASRMRVDYEPGESRLGTVRRQLELARADLVSGQLSAHRGAGALSPLLRRHLRVECPTGSGRLMNLGGSGPRAGRAADAPVPARSNGPPALPRRRPRASPTIRTGAICSCSTNTSTATPAAAWAPAIRPAGRRWSRGLLEESIHCRSRDH